MWIIILIALSAQGGELAPLHSVVLRGRSAYGPDVSFNVVYRPDELHECSFRPLAAESVQTGNALEDLEGLLRLLGEPVRPSLRFSRGPRLLTVFASDRFATFAAVDLSRNWHSKGSNGINVMRLVVLLCPPTLLAADIWEQRLAKAPRSHRRFWADYWAEYLTVTRSMLPSQMLMDARKACIRDSDQCLDLVQGAEGSQIE